MSKFRYFIVEVNDLTVEGTNDKALFASAEGMEDYYAFDSHSDTILEASFDDFPDKDEGEG